MWIFLNAGNWMQTRQAFSLSSVFCLLYWFDKFIPPNHCSQLLLMFCLFLVFSSYFQLARIEQNLKMKMHLWVNGKTSCGSMKLFPLYVACVCTWLCTCVCLCIRVCVFMSVHACAYLFVCLAFLNAYLLVQIWRSSIWINIIVGDSVTFHENVECSSWVTWKDFIPKLFSKEPRFLSKRVGVV